MKEEWKISDYKAKELNEDIEKLLLKWNGGLEDDNKDPVETPPLR